MRTLVAMVVFATASVAHADELVDPARSPGFVTLLRQDANSRAGADATYLFLDSGAGDVTVMRFDIHGHYVDPASGFGGYAQLPITVYSENSESHSVLGGAEVGGIFIPKLSSPGLGLVARAGITLPTVADDDDALAGLVATMLRPTDIYAQVPKSSTLRLSLSPVLRSGSFFARLDGGLDINVYADGGDTGDPALIINLGAGVDLGSAAIMGELSMFAITGDNGESFSSAAISVRGHAGSVQPYGALLIPVDNDVRDVFDAGLLLGLEGGL